MTNSKEHKNGIVVVADSANKVDFKVNVGDIIILSAEEITVRVVEIKEENILGIIVKADNEKKIGAEIIFQHSKICGIIR